METAANTGETAMEMTRNAKKKPKLIRRNIDSEITMIDTSLLPQ
jgi:hypothetical protein